MDLARQGGSFWQVGQSTPATPTSLSGTIDGVTCPKSIWCSPYIQFVLALDGITGNVPIDPSNILGNTINWRWFQVAFSTQNGQPFIGGNLTSLSLSEVSATPLPATWTMMLLGLAAIGFSAYCRATKSGIRRGDDCLVDC